MYPNRISILSILVIALMVPLSASAYIGPGAGITAIGVTIALLGAILLAIVGFVWYPIRRLRQKRKQQKADKEAASS